jgi:ubiquinol-cytochrome c reductase cytochrome c1 subunit
MKKLILFVLLALSPLVAQAEGVTCGDLQECLVAPVNANDTASLQRGAKLYISYCLGCHSAKYIRYDRMANDLKIDPKLAQQYLLFTGDKLGEQMTTRVNPKDQAKWFGATPPDLTLETRLRSPDWVYSYLLSFYPDDKRPWGVNNSVFKDVAMPYVLESLEKEQTPEQFKSSVADLVNFMSYMSEPTKSEREHLGVFVLIFLAILMIPVWFLNKEYWKDIE